VNVGSLLDELRRINDIFRDSSSNSAPLEAPTTPTLPYNWAPSVTLPTRSPSVPPGPVHQLTNSSLTSPGTPTIQSSGTTTSTPVTSSNNQSSGSASDTNSPSFSPSLRNTSTHVMSKSTVAVLVLISLFIFFSLILGGIALWMTRARRSRVVASRFGEEQVNVDNIDRSRPTTTITTAGADWLYGSRPPSDGSLYSDPHSPRPSEAGVRRTQLSVITSARLEPPPSMRELERGRAAASSPLSAHSLGSSSSGTHEVEINNVIRSARTSG